MKFRIVLFYNNFPRGTTSVKIGQPQRALCLKTYLRNRSHLDPNSLNILLERKFFLTKVVEENEKHLISSTVM
jgi:hypothetical protein